VSSGLEVRLSEAVVPGKTGHRFMPGYAQEGQMINPCPSHIGDGSMPEIMKPEDLNASILTSCLECLSHTSNWISPRKNTSVKICGPIKPDG